jgi:hypothetical protein
VDPVDRDYETLRIDRQTLFTDPGITTTQAAAAKQHVLSIAISRVSAMLSGVRSWAAQDKPNVPVDHPLASG